MSKSYNQYNNQHNQDNRQGNSEFYDEEEADQWRHRQQLQKKDHEERPVPKRTPDEVWLVNKFYYFFQLKF